MRGGLTQRIMQKIFSVVLVLLAVIVSIGAAAAGDITKAEAASRTDNDQKSEAKVSFIRSPEWIAKLPAAGRATQMVVVAAVSRQTAWISLNEKDSDGVWHQLITTPGFIGKNGIGKTREGDAMTPVGTFCFTKAFGIAPDPGCSIPYTQVDENIYWSGDERPGMRYNEMVDIRKYPNLNKESSEHIIEYTSHYQYCLNISYNEQGIPGKGSAIFMHCFGPNKPFTGGCVAIPYEKMHEVMQTVKPDCVVVIDSLEKLGGTL